jgi:hypothetical protein
MVGTVANVESTAKEKSCTLLDEDEEAVEGKIFTPDYEQTLFQQYQECKQGNRAVKVYTEEFYRLSSRNDLMETEAQQTARYIGGLRFAIQDRVTMQSVFTLVEAVNLAIKIETQLVRSKSQAPRNSPFNLPQFGSSKAVLEPSPQPFKSTSLENGDISISLQKHPEVPSPCKDIPDLYPKPRGDKCYRCGQPGHHSNQCPKRRAIHLLETGEEDNEKMVVNLEDSALTYTEDEITREDEGELLVIQRLLLTPKQEEPSQRHNIFKTKCTVNQKVCDVIIDSGSCENVVSKTMVKKLGLKTEKHPTAYSIGWIKKGATTKVTEICPITFSIGKHYIDKVNCVVVEMDASHMILGRPWLYDVDATHRGRDNVYIFMKGKKKIVLGPIKEDRKYNQQGKSVFLMKHNEGFCNAKAWANRMAGNGDMLDIVFELTRDEFSSSGGE